MRAVLALLLFILCGVVCAEERVVVCAEYTDTGKKYKVEAIQATGTELNTATHSLNYQTFAKYIVIFWKEGEATIINIGSLPSLAFGASGTDQQGRSWNVTTSTTFCF